MNEQSLKESYIRHKYEGDNYKIKKEIAESRAVREREEDWERQKKRIREEQKARESEVEKICRARKVNGRGSSPSKPLSQNAKAILSLVFFYVPVGAATLFGALIGFGKVMDGKNDTHVARKAVGIEPYISLTIPAGTTLAATDCNSWFTRSAKEITTLKKSRAYLIGKGDKENTAKFRVFFGYKLSPESNVWIWGESCTVELAPHAYPLVNREASRAYEQYLKMNNIKSNNRVKSSPKNKKGQRSSRGGAQTLSFVPHEIGSSYSAIQSYDNFSRPPIAGQVTARNFTCG